MLEKELAQATKMAEKANNKVEQLRKKLVAESEKANVKLKRELGAARKKHNAANARLKKARASLRKKATPDNQKKVDALLQQVQDLADAVAKITRAAYDAAERYMTVKTDAIMEERKARAANQAASLVEKAASKPKRKKRQPRKSPLLKRRRQPRKSPLLKRRRRPRKSPRLRRSQQPRKKRQLKRKLPPNARQPDRKTDDAPLNGGAVSPVFRFAHDTTVIVRGVHPKR